MIIHLATDHAGFFHKEAVAKWLGELGHQVIDHGAFILNSDDDFPDFVAPAAAAVGRKPGAGRAIIFGGSGQGEAMLANRYPGVRAVVYYGGDVDVPILTREHNDANILSIGARFVSVEESKEVIKRWLGTMPFPELKYARRNQKIEQLTRLASSATFRPVVPAVIPSSVEVLRELANDLSFSDELQVDVVDGEFVSAVSWPYQPNGDALSVRGILDKYDLEIDLMVKEPLLAASSWERAGADRLVFHIESVNLPELKEFISGTTALVGVSTNNTTPLESFLPYVSEAHYVQLMGIREIGAQGLPFDESVLERIKRIKEIYPTKLISIDGSVNPDTIVRLAAAGADRFVVGSAILSQADKREAHRSLTALVND